MYFIDGLIHETSTFIPGIGSDTAFVTPGDSMAPNFDHRHITNIKYYYIIERKKDSGLRKLPSLFDFLQNC